MRLIDADDFGNRMHHEAFEKDSDLQKWDSGCWIRYKLFENVLREQPTVQPDHVADISKKVEQTGETAQNVQNEDLIQRKAAIDAVKGLPTWWADEGGYYGGAQPPMVALLDPEDAVSAIENLPSAQPERKKSDWIPVERELPNDLEEVNVTWVNHEPEPYYEFIKSKPFTASAVFYKGKWYWYSSVCADVLGEYGRNDVDKVDDTIEITAWMPLPEPYRGGDK